MLVAGLGLRTGDGILDMFDCCLVVHLPGQSASLSLAKACTEIQMQISVRWYSFCLDRWKDRALLPLLQRPKFNLFVSRAWRWRHDFWACDAPGFTWLSLGDLGTEISQHDWGQRSLQFAFHYDMKPLAWGGECQLRFSAETPATKCAPTGHVKRISRPFLQDQ